MKYEQINTIKEEFERQVLDNLDDRLLSLYLVGSFTQNKMSDYKPDINLLLVFKGACTSSDYLIIGKIIDKVQDAFEHTASIRFEFRPFRILLPKYINQFEISINPIITCEADIKAQGCIYNKWFTNGLRSMNELIYGEDVLNKLIVKDITVDDLKSALLDLAFFTIPLSRAPAEYLMTNNKQLFHESYLSAKMIMYLGIVVALTKDELSKGIYQDYLKNKIKFKEYYKERYSEKASDLVSHVLSVRNGSTQVENSRVQAEEMFTVAINLGNLVKNRILLRV